MKHKARINFIIDVILFLLVLTKGGIGLLIKYTLIQGSLRWEVYGSNVELYLFGLERHQWGTIHLVCGYVFFGFLLLHIILHWKQIVSIYERLIRNRPLRRTVTVIFAILSIALLFFGLLLPHEVVPIGRGEGRQALERELYRALEREEPATTAGVIAGERLEEEKSASASQLAVEVETSDDELHHRTGDARVLGSMTLREVIERYQLSSDSLKAYLNIPLTTPDGEKLGRLRRQYGFHMSDVERFIERSIK